MGCTCEWKPLCDGRGTIYCWNRHEDCYCGCGCRDECGGCDACKDFDPTDYEDDE